MGQDVFLSVLTLVQWSCLFPSPGQAGLLFLFAFRVFFFFFSLCVSCYFSSPPWVLADTLFMTVSQKEGSGTAKKGGDLGWLIPRGPVLHPFLPTPMLPLMHSVKEPRAAASPRPCPHIVCRGFAQCHHSPLLLLTLAVTIWSFMTNRHLEADWVQRGYLWEGSFPSFGFQASFHTGHLVCTQYS